MPPILALHGSDIRHRRTRWLPLVARSNRKPNHKVIAVTIVLSCLVVVGFLMYDLHYLSQYYSNNYNPIPNWDSDSFSGYLIDVQLSLAVTMLVVMILHLLSGIAVYVGFKKKKKKLLLCYLCLTFPAMTFAALYAGLVPVNYFSTNYIVKIVSVIIVYAIQAIAYRMVYRMYQWLRHQSHDGTQSPSGDANRGNEGNSGDLPPVHMQLKPPPYEKEPPPYDLKPPGVNPSTSDLPPSPPYQSSHMTNTSSPELSLHTTTFSSDLHLSPGVHTTDIHSDASSPTALVSDLPGTTEESSRPSSTVSYDVPPSNTTSVYHIHMTEERLPTP